MSFLTEAKNGMKLAEHLDTGKFKTVLLPFFHGLGDTILCLPILKSLRELYPEITFTLGLCKGLDQETIVPDALLLDGDWREKALSLGFDLVFPWNMPLEKIEDLTKTKAEVSCIDEIGISPVSGHFLLKAKKLVGVNFQMTSIPWVANADEATANKIWNEIYDAGFIPIETYFSHCFSNPENKRYDFAKNHVRDWPARVETLMALIGSCHAFIGVVGGNWHMALSVLGKERVMLLEKDLKVAHFSKEKIASLDMKNYAGGEIKSWLSSLDANVRKET